MSSQWSTMDVPFTGGLDQKTRPEALPAGSFTQLHNVVQKNDGAYQLRDSYVTLSATGMTAPTKVANVRGVLAAVDSSCALKTYTASTATWRSVGQMPEPLVSRMSVAGTSMVPWFADIAVGGHYAAVAWSTYEASTTVVTGHVAVVDTSTGVRIAVDDVFGTAANLRFKLVHLSGYFFLLWRDDAVPGTLYYRRFDTSNPSAGWSVSAALPNAVDVNTVTPTFDVCVNEAVAAAFYVVYLDNTGLQRLTARAYGAGGAQLYTATYSGAPANITTVGCTGPMPSGDVCIAWIEGGSTLYVKIVASNLGAVTASNSLALPGNCDNLGIAYDPGQTASGHFIVKSTGTVTPTAWDYSWAKSLGTVTFAHTYNRYWYFPVTRPFYANNSPQVMVAHCGYNRTDQNTSAVIDMTPTNPMHPIRAMFAPRLSVRPWGLIPGSTLLQTAHAGTSASEPTAVYLVAFTKKSGGLATPIFGGWTYEAGVSIDLVRLDYSQSFQWQAAQVGESTQFSGGAVTWTDSNEVAESGFWVTPEIEGVSQQAGGSLTNGKTYQYTAIYEYVDATGCVQWSEPCTPVSLSVTLAAQLGRVLVNGLQCSCRGTKGAIVRVVLYRKNVTDGGLFQRVTTKEAPSAVPYVTIDDTLSDVDIASQPYLYTETGAIVRQIPPAMSCMVAHGDRVFGVDETGKSVWFTGQYVYGEAPWWSSSFQFPVDKGGAIMGLASMDGRLYVLKRDAIYFVDGQGPSDNGANPYALPQEIPCGVGCVNPLSVVVGPPGLFFQSDQGIYLLDRSHQATFIGRGVETLITTQNALVTGAVVDVQRGRVIFAIRQTAPSGGGRAIYDYVHNVWTTESLATTGAAFGPAVLSHTIVADSEPVGTARSYMACADGRIYQQYTSTPRDGVDGVWYWIPAKLETGWFKVGGEQNFWRVRDALLLSEYLGPHDLTMSLGYDYSSSYTDVRTFTNAMLSALVTTREQVGVSCSRQKVQAVRVLLQTATPSSGVVGSGAVTFMGLTFTVAPKRGAYRVPAANQQ